MTVINPQSGLVQPAADFTAGRSAEIYEVSPHYLKGTSIIPFYFTPTAGQVIVGSGGGTLVTLPNFLPASQLHQWTPYIRIKRSIAGGAGVSIAFTFLCTPDGDPTYNFPLMNTALPVPVAYTFTLLTLATTTYANYRVPPILGCDGFVKMVVSNLGAAGADDITIIPTAIWRP